MAKSKDDIKYGTAQSKLSEDESLRVAYKAGTPLEAGKISDSEPVDLFSAANGVSRSNQQQNKGVIADQPIDLFTAARHVADVQSKDEATMVDRQPSPN